MKDIALSRDALLEHIKRLVFGAGWLWKECFGNVVLPGPELRVWKTYFDLFTKYFPWCQQDYQTTIEDVVSTCRCKTRNCMNCRCGGLGKKCLNFCKCQWKCQKKSEIFYAVLDLSYVNMFFSKFSQCLTIPIFNTFFGLRCLGCDKQW